MSQHVARRVAMSWDESTRRKNCRDMGTCWIIATRLSTCCTQQHAVRFISKRCHEIWCISTRCHDIHLNKLSWYHDILWDSNIIISNDLLRWFWGPNIKPCWDDHEIRISWSPMTCCDDSEIQISWLVEMIMRFEYHHLQWLVAMIQHVNRSLDLLRWFNTSNIIISNHLLRWFNSSSQQDGMIFISHDFHLTSYSSQQDLTWYSFHMIFISYDIHFIRYSFHMTFISARCHVIISQQVIRLVQSSPHVPPTEEIRLEIFASRDPTIWSLDLLSDGDSDYTPENLYEKLETPVKTRLICTGTPAKTCWKFSQL